MDLALEEVLLGVPAGAPAQDAADIEVLAQDVPPHVLGLHPLGGALVMGTAGGVDVVVAGEPVLARQVNPPLELERLDVPARPGHRDGPGLRPVLGPAGVLDLVGPRAARARSRRSGDKPGDGRRSRAPAGGWVRGKPAPSGPGR